MKIALRVAVLLVSLAPLGTLSAQPVMQPYYPGFATLPPYEVVALVRSRGLDPVSRPVRQGPVYVLRALTATGQEVRVVIDAAMGRIVKITPVVPTDPGGFAPPENIPPGQMVPGGNIPAGRMAVVPPGPNADADFEPIRPPHSAPGAKPAPRTESKPPPAPLPRPKPKEAAAQAPAAQAPSVAASKTAPAAGQSGEATRPSASAENTAPPFVELDE